MKLGNKTLRVFHDWPDDRRLWETIENCFFNAKKGGLP